MQKTETRTDHSGYQVNFYECPVCKEMVSGQESWYQRGKQFHYKCLSRCASSQPCQHKETERGDLCASPHRCKDKYRGKRNQCDGCNAHIALKNGIHTLKDGTPHMACQSHLYNQ